MSFGVVGFVVRLAWFLLVAFCVVARLVVMDTSVYVGVDALLCFFRFLVWVCARLVFLLELRC